MQKTLLIYGGKDEDEYGPLVRGELVTRFEAAGCGEIEFLYHNFGDERSFPAIDWAALQAVLIDLPNEESVKLCGLIYNTNNTVPIILLLRVEMIRGIRRGIRTQAFESGADACIEPIFFWFQWREVLIRIRNLSHQAKNPRKNPDLLEVGNWALNTATYKLLRGDREQKLTGSEFKLLHLLMSSPNQVYSRTRILSLLQDAHALSTVEGHMNRLRKKLGQPKGSLHGIIWVRNRGYKFVA